MPSRTTTYRHKHKAMGLCATCCSPVVPGKLRCETHLAYARKRNIDRYNNDVVAAKARAKDYKLSLKLETFAAYGGAKCACCGESHFEFLVLDHIDGGGTKHRKILGGGKPRGGSTVYRWLKANGYPAGYRVLCGNCNSAMGSYGYCPHTVQQGANASMTDSLPGMN